MHVFFIENRTGGEVDGDGRFSGDDWGDEFRVFDRS